MIAAEALKGHYCRGFGQYAELPERLEASEAFTERDRCFLEEK